MAESRRTPRNRGPNQPRRGSRGSGRGRARRGAGIAVGQAEMLEDPANDDSLLDGRRWRISRVA
jgi:hypothetical protein